MHRQDLGSFFTRPRAHAIDCREISAHSPAGLPRRLQDLHPLQNFRDRRPGLAPWGMEGSGCHRMAARLRWPLRPTSIAAVSSHTQRQANDRLVTTLRLPRVTRPLSRDLSTRRFEKSALTGLDLTGGRHHRVRRRMDRHARSAYAGRLSLDGTGNDTAHGVSDRHTTAALGRSRARRMARTPATSAQSC